MPYRGFTERLARKQWVRLDADTGMLEVMPHRVRRLAEVVNDDTLAVWCVDFERPLEVWQLAVESAALWCNPKATERLEREYRLTDAAAIEFSSDFGVRIQRARHGYVATCANHQDGPRGEHETPLLAMADLARNLGLQDSIPMGTTAHPHFRNLVARQNQERPITA